MSTLAPHQERVVAERAELHERLEKLVAFVNDERFGSLDHDEQRRMQRQVRAMCDYREVLDERIAAFEVSA